jgi:hypothetical protein
VSAARPLLLLALCALLAGCAHTGAGQQRKGFRAATTTADALATVLDNRRIAVLVGTNTYRHPAFPDLRFAADDASALAELLETPDGGSFDEIVLLNDRDRTTRAAILDRLRSIRLGLGRGDTLVLYFSGHGTMAMDADGKPRLYLLPMDADPGDLEHTALDLEGLRDFLSSLPAQRKALIVDACFNGKGKSAVDPSVQDRMEQLVDEVAQSSLRGLASGEAHLFASTLGRPAFEDPELKHGVYTHYLLQAMTWARTTADLDRDGILTAWEAHDFARTRTREHTGGVQLAEASLRVVGANDLVLAGTPDARQKREQALLFHYGSGHTRFAGNTLVVDGVAKGVFPGTFAVAPGAHHIEVRDPDGQLRIDGYADLKPSQSVAASDLGVLVREDRVLAALRVGPAGGPPAWASLWGDGYLAAELFAALRAPRGLARGLFGGVTLGAGISPTRKDLDRLVEQGRGTFYLAGELGWGRDVSRLRLRGAWQVRMSVLPMAPFAGPEHDLESEEVGWIFASTGPVLHLGVIVDRRLAVVGVGTLQGTHLDPARAGAPSFQLFGSVTLGLELGF